MLNFLGRENVGGTVTPFRIGKSVMRRGLRGPGFSSRVLTSRVTETSLATKAGVLAINIKVLSPVVLASAGEGNINVL